MTLTHLLEIPPRLVVQDEVGELVGIDNKVQAAHTSELELLGVNARVAHLLPALRAVGLASAVHGSLELAKVHKSRCEPAKVGHGNVPESG